MANAKIDENFNPTLIGVSSADGETPIRAEINPATGGLIVDATVTAEVDTTGLASDANQTNGSQKTQIVDVGGEAVTVTGGKLDVNATASLAGESLPITGATSAVGVAIVDSSGDQIDSFGNGLTDTELRATPVVVDLGANNDVTVTSGTVTANAGTNLNTSALALESGGNLATIAGKDFATQTTLASLNAKVTAVNTGAVVVSSSALPSGAATAANQQTDALTDTQLRATAVPVSGTITANIGTVSTLATAAKQDALLTELQLKADLTETQPVSLASVPSHAVTNAGTFVVQENGAALAALQLIDDTVFADDAAYTLGTSKGSVIEGVAVETDGTDPTTVSAEGDAAALRTDRQRVLLVNPTPPRHWNVSADYASAQTNTSIQAAPGAGLKLYITDISISNGATAGNITLLDGSGGTVKYEIYPAINGGAVDNRRTPIVLTANTALCITSTTVTTHSVNISGYIAP